MAAGFAGKRQGKQDNAAVESWGSLESPQEILACLQMIYSSYHLFFARYH
ncbi:hypothetical protein MY9_2821 [Bacillus sp. JS]|nr:hypothetical protein MY9_2821 [Bacillus sp. JS]